MKLGQLIKELQKIEETEGEDVLVTKSDWMNSNILRPISISTVTKVKSHFSSFYQSGALANGGYAGRNAFQQPYQSEIESRPDIKVVFIG